MQHVSWEISGGNVVSWALVVIGFVSTQYITVKILGNRMDNFEKWRDFHEMEAGDRDKLITVLDKAIVELATLAKVATSRLEMLERRKADLRDK